MKISLTLLDFILTMIYDRRVYLTNKIGLDSEFIIYFYMLINVCDADKELVAKEISEIYELLNLVNSGDQLIDDSSEISLSPETYGYIKDFLRSSIILYGSLDRMISVILDKYFPATNRLKFRAILKEGLLDLISDTDNYINEFTKIVKW